MRIAQLLDECFRGIQYQKPALVLNSVLMGGACPERSRRCHRIELTDEIDRLRSAFRSVARRHPFSLEPIVVLPEHLHCIWTLPAGDADFVMRWRLIKSEFSKHIAPGEGRSPSRAAKGERGIWQRRYWEHTLRDEGDFARHCDYIHFNPVKHGHVSSAKQWPFSTFGRFVQSGVYPTDRGGGGSDDHADYGERVDV